MLPVALHPSPDHGIVQVKLVNYLLYAEISTQTLLRRLQLRQLAVFGSSCKHPVGWIGCPTFRVQFTLRALIGQTPIDLSLSNGRKSPRDFMMTLTTSLRDQTPNHCFTGTKHLGLLKVRRPSLFSENLRKT